MKPTKLKYHIPELAKQFQLSEQEIESVLDAYWTNIRKTLSSLEYNKVFLKELGTFYIKPWSLNKKLIANNNVIDRYVQNPTTGGLTIINSLTKDNLKIQKALDRDNEYKIDKQQKRDERNKENLEEQE